MERRVGLHELLRSICIVEDHTLLSFTFIKILVADRTLSDLVGEDVDPTVEPSLLSRIFVLCYVFSHFMLPLVPCDD